MTRAPVVEELAAKWLMRREDGDWSHTDQAALETWLDQSMAHKAAFWRLEHGWRKLDRIGALGLAEPVERVPSWRILVPAALAASIAVVAFVTYPRADTVAVRPATPAVAYKTAVGQQLQIPLADGSRVELNTATNLRASLAGDRREVWLDDGEAYFEVRHADDKPFVVHSGPRTITVLGTKFVVRRTADGGVRVVVVEGRVRMSDTLRGEAAASAIINRGDMALADGESTLVTHRTAEQLRNETAWRTGTLSFDQASLRDAAEEFNRYNETQLSIADTRTGAIRIGGSFRAHNVEGFARLLEVAYGLRVEKGPKKMIIRD